MELHAWNYLQTLRESLEPPFRTQSQFPTKRDREIHQQRQKPNETGGL